jgi:transposase
VIGIDLGDKRSHICVLNEGGACVETGTVVTTPSGFEERFKRIDICRIAIEAGGQSAWVDELLTKLGHEVVVANPRRLRMIYENDSRSDEVDAEQLARVARLHPSLLHGIEHRKHSTRVDLGKAQSRDMLVATRTTLINHVRGQMKSFGMKLGTRGAAYFHNWAREQVPEELKIALDPILDLLEQVDKQIKVIDTELERLAEEVYPVTQLLRQVDRVGLHTALRFVLTVEDPFRIKKSRNVAAYFGRVSQRKQSCVRDPEMHITKAGDGDMRRLLVQCAQQMLSAKGKESDLRIWGLNLASRGAKAAKKKAVIATARKLAVLLHVLCQISLWMAGQVYEPLQNETGRVPGKAACA